MKTSATLLFCAAFLYFSEGISAHEGRPIFIEVRTIESLDNRAPNYILRWKTPPVFAAGTEPEITMQNSECLEVAIRENQKGYHKNKQKLIGSKHYHCPVSAEHLKVNIRYPDINPALSSLLLFYDQSGVGKHIYSGPDIVSIPLSQELDTLEVATQYITGGIKHILLGWDHLCFVFCLIILAGRFSRLLVTISGFTLAHTVTLIAATFNLITVPILFVEVLIALSIALLAAEIIRNQSSHTKSLTREYPVIAASLLGLLHGFGFASVLSELGLPSDMKLTALLFFNLGIEFGQVIFICGILLLVYILSRLSILSIDRIFVKHKAQGLVSTLYIVGITASYWVVERFITLL